MLSKLISVILLLITLDFAGCNKEQEEIKPIVAVKSGQPTSSTTIKDSKTISETTRPTKHLQDHLLTTDNTISSHSWKPTPKIKETPTIPQAKTIYAEQVPQTVTVYAEDQQETTPQPTETTIPTHQTLPTTSSLETTPSSIIKQDTLPQEEAEPQ